MPLCVSWCYSNDSESTSIYIVEVSLMFATRDLPTCRMLIRKHAYIFMKSAAESRNVILHSIVRSDSLFTSPLWQHWRHLCVYTHSRSPGFFDDLYGCNLSTIKQID